MKLEAYSQDKHDTYVVASLIYSSDEEMNSLVFGEKEQGVKIIGDLITNGDGYFSPPYLKCAIHQDEIVGVIVSFNVREKAKMDSDSGKAFARAMGGFTFLRKMPLFMRMAKLTSGEMDETGTYIHTISVTPSHQGRSFGTRMIEVLAAQEEKLYLHVNINKQLAQKFYKKLGFQSRHKATMMHKGREIGTYLMERA